MNKVSRKDFVSAYGAIYEHSPWVAERAFAVIDATDIELEQLANVMADCVDNASGERQLELIRAHPDLAGKAQVAGELTADSTEEQSSAGLDRCNPEEFERFQYFNATYKNKFEFPFIMAVRNSDRHKILQAFERRIENEYDTEFETALQEIHKIARLRLAAMEAD